MSVRGRGWGVDGGLWCSGERWRTEVTETETETRATWSQMGSVTGGTGRPRSRAVLHPAACLLTASSRSPPAYREWQPAERG